MTREVSSQVELLSFNEEKLITLSHVINNLDEINNVLHEQSLEQNRDLREPHMKSLNEMEELKPFQGSNGSNISLQLQEKIDRRSRYYP